MAAKSRTKTPKNFWGLEAGALLTRYINANVKGERKASVTIQLEKTKGAPAKSVVRVLDGEEPQVLITPLAAEEIETEPSLKVSSAIRVRDAMGALVSAVERLDVQAVEIDYRGPAEMLEFVALGLEIALYRYRRVWHNEEPKYKVALTSKGKAIAPKTLAEGIALGWSINVARHLTNLPPNLLNPKTYSEFVAGFFAGMKGVTVEVWDFKRLKVEKMNLHIGVGKSSNRQPRLARIKYSGAGKKPTVALVGKGITFDTGGLDIKPSSGMRLMKKDMGGSAAVVGTILWAALSGAKCNVEGFLALAENAISDKSFRPSDVIRARNGMTVEIHNTDAEGRLVLADAMDVAADTKPAVMVDVATLTGAIKVALGSGVAGLFGNDKKLVAGLHKAGQVAGDLNWPMPLIQKYRGQLHSHFADMINATDGFGGAITAALFLEKFAKGVPWAHLDIYAWKDSADGAWCESGGSGQAVACLARWLQA